MAGAGRIENKGIPHVDLTSVLYAGTAARTLGMDGGGGFA